MNPIGKQARAIERVAGWPAWQYRKDGRETQPERIPLWPFYLAFHTLKPTTDLRVSQPAAQASPVIPDLPTRNTNRRALYAGKPVSRFLSTDCIMATSDVP